MTTHTLPNTEYYTSTPLQKSQNFSELYVFIPFIWITNTSVKKRRKEIEERVLTIELADGTILCVIHIKHGMNEKGEN